MNNDLYKAYRDQLAKEEAEIAEISVAFKAGAASRDAEIQRLQFALADSEALELGTAERCDALQADNARLVAALEPFGAIDLVESRLPAEFAMLILRARAAIAKVRKL